MENRIQNIFKDIPTLTTERLTLRKILKSDLYDVHDYAKDPMVTKYLLWNPHPNLDTTRQYLKTVTSYYKSGKFYDWGIVSREDGRMIGTCGFSNIDFDNNSAEIGYVLNSRYWGRGIATEAVRRVIDFGFNSLGFHRLEARYMLENEKSRRILEKCGMTPDGVLRDAVKKNGEYISIEVYSIIKSTKNTY